MISPAARTETKTSSQRRLEQPADTLNPAAQLVSRRRATVNAFGWPLTGSVTDPRGLVTSYSYNGFEDATQTSSPDTGTTLEAYDSGGNPATIMDARGKTGTYSYDPLNRLTSISYPDETINFTYDTGTNGVGRLASAAGTGNSLTYTHDAHGRISSKVQVVGSVSKTVGYGYNSAGQLTSLMTPKGYTINYTYANNRIASVGVNGMILAYDVTYDPFGPVTGWTWGNGTVASRSYDADGRPTGVASAGGTTFSYDSASRITAITDLESSARSWSYGFDALDHLTSATRTGLSQGWTYDANGNRLAQSGTSSSTYTVSPTSNRVSSITGSLSRTYAYANSGQATSYGGLNFTYNDAGRLTSVSGSGSATYLINPLGQRVRKTTASEVTYFVYDESGHLIGEYDSAGDLIEEIVWMDDTPVLLLRNSSCGLAIFYVHTDHLNTPRKVTRRSEPDVVWRWDSDPFGTTPPDEDPDGDGVDFKLNLRFAGQYFDVESGLSYNYFRDYDPAIGRYIESDPIGLRGGINTYAYVGGSPLRFSDARGLNPYAAAEAGYAAGEVAAAAINAGLIVVTGTTLGGWIYDVLHSDSEERARGLPPEGVKPPVEGECEERPASRPSEQARGGKSLWDKKGGEWRWFPENKWHNDHWDYNPHTRPDSPWENVPHGGKPPVKE